MNKIDNTNKKLFILDDEDVIAILLLTTDQAAMFYYLKDNDFLYSDDMQLVPVVCGSQCTITYKEFHC